MITRFLRYIINLKKTFMDPYRSDKDINDDCALMNMRRLGYVTALAIPVHVCAILMFVFTVSDSTAAQALWRRGIILTHGALLAIMITLLIISVRHKKRTRVTPVIRTVQYFAACIIMLFGAILVLFDQLVTNSIIPYMAACLIIGSIFLIRPIIAFAIHIASYTAYYFLISLTAASQAVLVSVRINGFVAIGIGFALSLIMWRKNYVYLKQKQRIERQQAQLEQMAYYDFLTGLSNRRFFDERIKYEITSIQAKPHESSIIILDIDYFKSINDTYGHPAGDSILRQLAKLLAGGLRETDIISRYGGEEFIILLPQTSLDGALAVAEKLRELIERHAFTVESGEVHITASFGVSLLYESNGQMLFSYYSPADKALYAAKQNGRNRVESAA